MEGCQENNVKANSSKFLFISNQMLFFFFSFFFNDYDACHYQLLIIYSLIDITHQVIYSAYKARK